MASSSDAGRATDAALAAAVLAVATGYLVVTATPLSVSAATLGVIAAVVVEALLSIRRTAVRRVWAARSVKTGAVVVAVAAVAVGHVVAPAWVPSAMTGALVAYLTLLGVVSLAVAVSER